jgi:hypothetical protein
MAGAVVLHMPARPLRPQIAYGLEDGALVRRAGRRETRWPLSRLKRFTLGSRRGVRFVRLVFIGHMETIACGARAEGYAAFVRALAAAAARQAPGARFERQGGKAAAALILAAALMGAGALAMALAALMAGLAPLGLDLAARLAFLVILIFALTPWIGRAAPPRLDPFALPEDLVD